MGPASSLWSNANVHGLFEVFSQTSTAAMAINDVDGIILWCNDTWANVYEQPRNEISGSHLKDRIVYPNGIGIEDRIQQAIEHGYTDKLQTTWNTITGKKKFMHQALYRLDDNQGKHIGFWKIAYELTAENTLISDSKAAIRLLTEMREEEIKEKQLEVIEKLKVQGNILCPAKKLRGKICPAILAVEESIVKEQSAISALLTNTELEIARYVKRGISIKKMADKMSISERTVKNHRHSIRKKLNISNTQISLTKYLQSFPL